MRKFIVTEDEKKDIVNQHDKLKYILIEKIIDKYQKTNPKVLNEYDDWRDEMLSLCPFFIKFANDVQKKYLNNQPVIELKITDTNLIDLKSQSTDVPYQKGDLIYIFENDSFEWWKFENGNYDKQDVISKWTCEKAKTEKKKNQEVEIQQYKKTGAGGQWYTWEEATTPDAKGNTIINLADPNSYRKVKLSSGVWLFQPKTIKGISGVSTTFQQQLLQPYLDQNWKFPSQLTADQLKTWEPFVVPGSEDAFGYKVTLYKNRGDIKTKKEDLLSRVRNSNATETFEISDCKDYIDAYFAQYKLGKQRGLSPDPDLKTATQSCLWQHHNSNWGGVAFSGKQKYNRICDLFVGERDSYDGIENPLVNSEWRLLPKGYQPINRKK